MTDRRSRLHAPLRALVRQALLAVFVVAATAANAHAQAPAACSPPCADGQTCIQGMCMIPAAPAPAPAPAPGGAYPPPPNGYPPPQNGYPPPGYPPPQGYPPPAAYSAQVPSYPPPPPPVQRRHRVFMFLPYIGFHSFLGNNAQGLDAGFHLGGMMGFRIGDFVSLNGELSLDVLNPNNTGAGNSYSETDFTLTFSPMIHIPAGNVELAFGPKLGLWGGVYNQSNAFADGDGSYSGVDLGSNFGVFFQVGRHVWLGGILSFDSRSYSQNCFTPTGGSQGCTSTGLPPADKVGAMSFALML